MFGSSAEAAAAKGLHMRPLLSSCRTCSYFSKIFEEKSHNILTNFFIVKRYFIPHQKKIGNSNCVSKKSLTRTQLHSFDKNRRAFDKNRRAGYLQQQLPGSRNLKYVLSALSVKNLLTLL